MPRWNLALRTFSARQRKFSSTQILSQRLCSGLKLRILIACAILSRYCRFNVRKLKLRQNQNEHTHLSTQLCRAIMNQGTDHRRQMCINSTDNTEPKSTERMPFKLYISIMSHYSTPSCTVGSFISSWLRACYSAIIDHPPASVLRRYTEYQRISHECSRMILFSGRKW